MPKISKIIVCPLEEKMRLLKENSTSSSLENIKYMTKEEFFNHYYFSYDEKAVFYLMKKYHWNIDVVHTYLSYLYVIDEKKTYQNPKLQFLKDLKSELKEAGVLTFYPSFQHYLSKKEIEVRNYYDLNLYEEEALDYSFVVPEGKINAPVYAFSTMEEEINFVCLEILKLIKQGVDLEKIFLVNVNEEYYFLLEKLFSYYHIPINIPYHDSIYSQKDVLQYLKTGVLTEEDFSNQEIYSQLIEILKDYVDFDMNDEIVKEMILYRIRHTYYPNEVLAKAVQIKNLYNEDFANDEFIFVLGFNQDSLPKIRKDIDYLTDSEKKEVSLYTTSYWNEREKKLTIFLLSKIFHLYLSYKKESPFASFFPSSLIEECGLEVIDHYTDSYQFSTFYNQLRFAEEWDQFYLYGEKTPLFEFLFSHYSIPYRTYSNQFGGISSKSYLEHLPKPLNLSYTSLNTYSECPFRYYLQYVLNLHPYEDNFSSFVGSLYHQILSSHRKKNFDFEKEYQTYLEKRDLSLKERMLLVPLHKDLLNLIEVLNKQQYLTGYDEEIVEKKVVVPLSNDESVQLVGYIDKIMYYRHIEDTYFSIIDYKTGEINTHLETIKYGLSMQLAVYLYLIHYGNVFKNPIFTGIYYQNILFPYPTWSLKLEKEEQEKYYLKGYSTDNIELLSLFDSTYEDSTYIKSMKYSSEKGFGPYSKVLDEDTLYHLLEYTKKKIEEEKEGILGANFTINPKVYEKENISCRFCPFRDICYRKEKELVYLEKVDDLSFLGGEE